MSPPDFAVTWVHGELRAARLVRGVPADTWTAPDPVPDLRAFSESFHEAAIALGMANGIDIVMLYEGPDLHHKLVQVPKLGPRDLASFLQRQVGLEPPFEEPAAFGYHVNNVKDLQQSVLLHVTPKRVVDAIVRICEENHLLPRRVTPITEVVAARVKDARVDPETLLLVACCFTDHTVLTITRGDGQVLVVRELNLSFEDPRRLEAEFNRTSLFAKQRLRQPVDEAWVIGAEAEAFSKVAGSAVEVPVSAFPGGDTANFWLEAAATLSNETPANLVPKLVRRSFGRRRTFRWALWATAALFLATISLTVVQGLVMYFGPTLASTADVEREIVDLEEQIAEIEARRDLTVAARENISRLKGDASPLGALFLANVAHLVPPRTRLTAAAIAANDQGFEFEISGETMPPLGQARDTVELLANRLESAPWHGAVSPAWREDWMRNLREGGAVIDEMKAFRLQGQIR